LLPKLKPIHQVTSALSNEQARTFRRPRALH
jgi:hypothetical protein